MPLHECDETSIDNVPIKNVVKYLGIHMTRNLLVKQHLNFNERIKKTRNIFNLWLQRDLTLYGRVLLSKAEGLSRFVYPSLSLFVNATPQPMSLISYSLILFGKKNPTNLKKQYYLTVERTEVLKFSISSILLILLKLTGLKDA